MQQSKKTITTVISGEYEQPTDVTTSSESLDIEVVGFIPRYIFTAAAKTDQASLVRINKQLGGDYSLRDADTRNGGTLKS